MAALTTKKERKGPPTVRRYGLCAEGAGMTVERRQNCRSANADCRSTTARPRRQLGRRRVVGMAATPSGRRQQRLQTMPWDGVWRCGQKELPEEGEERRRRFGRRQGAGTAAMPSERRRQRLRTMTSLCPATRTMTAIAGRMRLIQGLVGCDVGNSFGQQR